MKLKLDVIATLVTCGGRWMSCHQTHNIFRALTKLSSKNSASLIYSWPIAITLINDQSSTLVKDLCQVNEITKEMSYI